MRDENIRKGDAVIVMFDEDMPRLVKVESRHSILRASEDISRPELFEFDGVKYFSNMKRHATV